MAIIVLYSISLLLIFFLYVVAYISYSHTPNLPFPLPFGN